MKLYLSSYRIGEKKLELENWIKEHDNRILVIPNALDMFADGERKTNGIVDKCNELTQLGFNYEILDLRDYFNKYDLLLKKLEKFKAFYVLGGNVFVLRRAMKLSGFDCFLKENYDNPNYLYSGFSAGICVLASDLHGIHLVDDPNIDPYNFGEIIWEGIGLLNYLPVPHYDTPNHPESEKMYDVIDYLKMNNLDYKTLKDGEVIIDEIKKQDIKNTVR